MASDSSDVYLPNFGRPNWPEPLSLDERRYPELDAVVNVYLVVRRTDQKGHTSRDQHWLIFWDRGSLLDEYSGNMVPITRRLQIVREMILQGPDMGGMLPHLTNWGATSNTPTGDTTEERSQRILIKSMSKAQRVQLEAIGDRTRVRVPNGEWNCQDWCKTVLATAVEEGLVDQASYESVVMSAEKVPTLHGLEETLF
ncbi:hypothetical protein D9619_010916 [Psilocybe cf. subviscida]|uniref:Uncharacterized protein n=1 Tax=Psilocybe cf. subviscida TaxID=2480587 RepID=A0A8H5B8M9_9AGAR|nr:hypothetical protein D9619_010916 [Psilocybe cf. subviscida]